jgi:glucose-1-phosphate adenylyltransferase
VSDAAPACTARPRCILALLLLRACAFRIVAQQDASVDEYLILSGDHLYRMDYTDFIRKHRETGADITVSAVPMDEKRATSFGVMLIDNTGRITNFGEKPKGAALHAFKCDTTVLGLDAKRAQEMPYIASMGIYVFKKDVMEKLLQNDFPMANDFGGEVIPGAKDKGYHVQAYLFDGYWEDIGTIESFYNANLNLASANPNFSFYDKASPIYTQSRFLPPSKLVDCMIDTSIIGDGCSIRKASITGSVIGLRSIIHSDCKIEASLLMGADYFETYSECSALPGCTPIGIGAGTHIKRAIIDKNARIGMDCVITNAKNVQEANLEEQYYIIKDGIVTVMKDAIIPQVRVGDAAVAVCRTRCVASVGRAQTLCADLRGLFLVPPQGTVI